MDTEKEKETHCPQASLRYAMEQDQNKQIGLGKSLAAIHQSRAEGLIGVPDHLEAQDYMAIIISEKWKDLIDGAKLLALYQYSDTRPADSMWSISSEDWDRSAAVTSQKGWIISHENKKNRETYQEFFSRTQQREGPTRAKYGPDAGILHFVYWIAKGQARRVPIVSLDNIKGSYANRTVRTFFNWFPTCSNSWIRSNISFAVNRWTAWPTCRLNLQPNGKNSLVLFLDWPWSAIFVSLHLLTRETPNRAMSA
ncbi:hypothetical protein HD553DRAFT_324430 [Filobasidium floriforme]|uniref:uncharacterized protein n=1 Tax=Filobasidium floriforme TaxID=5210 RepID=UPI001E8E4F42|nr:uncharacterized protein HD553DRAFT_324430 [Filobasidium floriforme]KAH8083517.1 hypothetical protein HD553DRAFT_324430 [Filobasidium floriforme]